jgi:predicted membrane protein
MKRTHNSNSNLTLGLIFLVIGGVLLLKTMGFFFPAWVLTWPMILIAIGVITLIRHEFQSGFGFFMVLLGGFFLLKREVGIPAEFEPYILPIVFILIGFFFIINQSRRGSDPFSGFTNLNTDFDSHYEPKSEYKTQTSYTRSGAENVSGSTVDDFINAQALFSSVEKRCFTKNFQGGKISSLFGGVDVDFSKADLQGEAILNVEVAFGGLKLIVPPHWDIDINVSNVAAGVEDKRAFPHTNPDPNKVLRINGSLIFGGLEIRSY